MIHGHMHVDLPFIVITLIKYTVLELENKYFAINWYKQSVIFNILRLVKIHYNLHCLL